jgi:hypothetical protein
MPRHAIEFDLHLLGTNRGAEPVFKHGHFGQTAYGQALEGGERVALGERLHRLFELRVPIPVANFLYLGSRSCQPVDLRFLRSGSRGREQGGQESDDDERQRAEDSTVHWMFDGFDSVHVRLRS